MPHNIKRAIALCGLFALIAAGGGCQRGPAWNLTSVEGTVTKDGQPLPNIEVTFFPDLEVGEQGPRSTAVTDESGRYCLQAHYGESGAVVGKHRVTLLDPNSRITGGMPMPVKASRIPTNCAVFDKTPLRVEIQSGPQVIDFDVKSTSVNVKLIGSPGK